jgi:hypothetical protein
MAGAPQQPLTFNDVFEEEEHMEPKEAHTIHHIRANSSIMHLDKILGELPTVLGGLPAREGTRLPVLSQDARRSY